MKKCKTCECNKDGKCLLTYRYVIQNRQERIEYKSIDSISKCNKDVKKEK